MLKFRWGIDNWAKTEAHLICLDSLCPSQQFFSHVGTGLPY